MKSPSDELRIIPGKAWLIAIGVVGVLVWLMVTRPYSMTLGHMETVVLACILLLLLVCILLIGYINADARRRGMRQVMWTLLAIFIPYGIGVILYFVLRDPLLIPCPRCGAMGKPSFVYCPKCGGDLSPSCPACRRPVESEWVRCAYCGSEISGQSVSG